MTQPTTPSPEGQPKHRTARPHSHAARRPAGQGGLGKLTWKNPILLIAILLIIAVTIALIVILAKSNSEEENGEAIFDTHAAQTDLPTPAEGIRNSISNLELAINGDTAPVDFVQLTEQRSLIPPTDVSRLGWYSASAIPGEPGNVGSSVITGHINEASQGEGYAAKFTKLKIGDEVTVKVDDEDRVFRVITEPKLVVKGDELPESINDATGSNRLVLVTCGGKFVGGTLGYAENVIVEAEPIS